MKKNYMVKRYKKGDLVYAKVRPSVILVVRFYIRNIYHCSVQNDSKANILLYLDSELMPYRKGVNKAKFHTTG